MKIANGRQGGVAVLLALALWCVTAPSSRAQSLPLVLSAFSAVSEDSVIVLPTGKLYSFREDEGQVLVFLDGVTVQQGTQRLTADSLVVVLGRDEVNALPAEPPSEAPSPDSGPLPPAAAPERGVFMPGSRIREMFLEGYVTVDENDVRTLEAAAIYVDNTAGDSFILDGRMRAFDDGHPLVLRFKQLTGYADGNALLQTVDYSTCEHGNTDFHMSTDTAILTPTEKGRILKTSDQTFAVGYVPIFRWPGMSFNIDDNEGLLIRDLNIGSSGRFGTEIETVWGGDADGLVNGVARMLGSDEELEGEWETRIAAYSARGLFIEPTIAWEGPNSKGRFLASHIADSADEDELDQPITDNTRGRIDLESRTYFERNDYDDFRVLDIDISYLSDRNFLNEYYEREAKIGREQDTYLWYRDIEGNEARTLLIRPRLNDFESQVEYLPEVQRRLLAEETEAEWLRGAKLTVTDTFSNARFSPDEDNNALDSVSNLRIGRRARLDWDIDTGEGERLRVTAGADATYLSGTQFGGADIRTSLLAAVEYQQTYVGVDQGYSSETWNLDGIRQILEPRIGIQTRFGTNHQPEELEVIDDIEQLDDNHLIFLGVRHRIQTHQDNKVKTILDTDVIIPFYPNESRDNAGQVEGDVIVDMRYRPGANIWGLRDATLRWRAVLDPNDRGYEQSYLSYNTRIDETKRFYIANNKTEGLFNFLTVGVLWELTEKWSSAVFWQRDQRLNETARAGFMMRRTGCCWILDYIIETERGTGITGEDRDDTQFEIRLRPTAFDRRRPGDDDILDDIGSRIR